MKILNYELLAFKIQPATIVYSVYYLTDNSFKMLNRLKELNNTKNERLKLENMYLILQIDVKENNDIKTIIFDNIYEYDKKYNYILNKKINFNAIIKELKQFNKGKISIEKIEKKIKEFKIVDKKILALNN